MKITIYAGATLSAAADVADKVMAGAVDIGWLYTAYFADQCPLTDIINLPMARLWRANFHDGGAVGPV